jgi:hypothetical protein
MMRREGFRRFFVDGSGKMRLLPKPSPAMRAILGKNLVRILAISVQRRYNVNQCDF